MNSVEKYIDSHWDECINENMEDVGSLIGMPYPYTVPAVGHFDEMYYWDTYFTNKGLECSGRYMQAKHNVDNMLYLVEKYGFMPNGNRECYINHSQPPFLSEMVKDVYKHYKDKAWLRSAYIELTKEYEFWMSKRCFDNGLNFYGTNKLEDYMFHVDGFCKRTGHRLNGDPKIACRHVLGSCESGWDMNPRWDFECYNFAPIDLNALLYLLESNMVYFANELDINEAVIWQNRANERKSKISSLMKSNDGILLDYNVKTKKLSKIFSAASFFPLYVKCASDDEAEAIVKSLSKLEAEYGILTCEKNDSGIPYQWDYPNGWACLQYIAFIGLANYGYTEDAIRIAKKYVNLAEKVFEETCNLWEKYNVIEGNINVSNEYKIPPMMGWSAGVYLAAKNFITEMGM